MSVDAMVKIAEARRPGWIQTKKPFQPEKAKRNKQGWFFWFLLIFQACFGNYGVFFLTPFSSCHIFKIHCFPGLELTKVVQRLFARTESSQALQMVSLEWCLSIARVWHPKAQGFGHQQVGFMEKIKHAILLND